HVSVQGTSPFIWKATTTTCCVSASPDGRLSARRKFDPAPGHSVGVMELVYGAGKIDRRVADAEVLLRDWREKEKDYGQLYLEFASVTPRDRVLVEDLAATMLVNSRLPAPAATSVYRHWAAVALRSLPRQRRAGETDA